jgi:hypothetical protein
MKKAARDQQLIADIRMVGILILLQPIDDSL